MTKTNHPFFINYAFKQAQIMESTGHERCAETYISAAKSFRQFLENKDIPIAQLESRTIKAYEAFLTAKGLSMNTVSFYMRNLRAIYNHAVEENLAEQHFPFKRTYTGICKTVKRAVSIDTIQKIASLDYSVFPDLEFSADIFLFSFYTRGTAFVDIAYLQHKNIKNGYLTYHRKKTGQRITIRWERCMAEIVEKYHNHHSASPYLLPILKGNNTRTEYLTASHRLNRNLKKIGQLIDSQTPLTLYVARHSWASIAHSKQIPIATISEALGHNSESTTRIYLTSLDNSAVDNANRLVLGCLGDLSY